MAVHCRNVYVQLVDVFHFGLREAETLGHSPYRLLLSVFYVAVKAFLIMVKQHFVVEEVHELISI